MCFLFKNTKELIKMDHNYENNLLKIEHENDILHFTALKDQHVDSDITEIKEYFKTFFELLITQPTDVNYAFIFDIRVVSAYNLFTFAKDLKQFFKNYETELHRFIGCTSIITDNSFIRIVLAPLIKLINKGRALQFTRNTQSAITFARKELDKLNQERAEKSAITAGIVVDPPASVFRSHDANDVTVEDFDVNEID